MDLWIMLKEDEEFRGYVDRYCKKHQITPEEAIRHVLVKAYAEDLAKRPMKIKRETVEEKVNCGGC